MSSFEMSRLFSAGAALLILAAPLSLAAQDADDLWESEAELGGAIFFGNTEQTTITTRLSTARADSLFEWSSDLTFLYGETEDDSGDATVNKRSWIAGAELDYRPFSRFSPFATATVESSLENEIDRRYSGGVGARYIFVRNERSRLDFSLAALAEKTEPRGPVAETVETDVLARLSARLRARREFDDGRLVFTTTNFYQPQASDFDNYTVTSESSLAFAMNETVSLKFTLIDRYDSLAEARGAETNNDGQVLFSLLAAF